MPFRDKPIFWKYLVFLDKISHTWEIVNGMPIGEEIYLNDNY